MTDLHCHIIPGIDDGAENMEQALQMARMAVRSGVTTIAATPHTNISRIFENYASRELDASFAALRNALQQENIPLELVKGAEIYYDGNVVDMLRRGTVCTINDSRYPLVEFSFQDHASRVIDGLQKLLDAGYTPIIAHPERYRFVQRDPIALLRAFTEMGCVLQMNKGSPLGRFGRESYQISHWMLAHGVVHIIASDAHSDIHRTPYLADIREFLLKEYGDGCPQLLLEINPKHILYDEPVEITF